tara:strand:+ start:277 stop:489 length:213 start_codon:yes stop_codon:yes gene_type:complete
MMIRNDFGEKKILVKKIFFGSVFNVKSFTTMSMSWTNFEKNLKKVALGGLNIALGSPEVSENVSLTQNTI